MSSVKDGGQAFPAAAAIGPQGDVYQPYEGMSLYQWFAGQALAGLSTNEEMTVKDTAKIAYDIADAMIAERELAREPDGLPVAEIVYPDLAEVPQEAVNIIKLHVPIEALGFNDNGMDGWESHSWPILDETVAYFEAALSRAKGEAS